MIIVILNSSVKEQMKQDFPKFPIIHLMCLIPFS